jgi:hypothetical protein
VFFVFVLFKFKNAKIIANTAKRRKSLVSKSAAQAAASVAKKEKRGA